MATVDVTVFGAGAFGLSVAYACARAGAKVRVIDPAGVAAGSSGGVVGALAPHVPENWNDKKAFQLDSLLMAAEVWAGVEAASGHTVGYARTGRLQPLADDAAVALAQQRDASARTLWGEAAKWRVVRATGAAWEPASSTGFLVHDTLTARIHPRRATLALAAAVVALGGEVVTDGPREGRIVHATGWRGLVGLSSAMGRSVGAGIKGQAALLRYDAADLPQLFAGALHIVPHDDGTVAIGSTTEREFDAPDTTDDQLDDIVARARAALPVLADAPVIERWAGVRPRARSRAPMLGPHPLYPDEFIANGGFKIGFSMAPKVGAVMAALVLEGRDEIPEGFRPEASL